MFTTVMKFLSCVRQKADEFNTAGDKEEFRVSSINSWSNAAINWAKASPTGNYVGNRSQIDSTAPGGQAEYLSSLVNNGVIDNTTKNSLLKTLKLSYKGYYGSTRVTPGITKRKV